MNVTSKPFVEISLRRNRRVSKIILWVSLLFLVTITITIYQINEFSSRNGWLAVFLLCFIVHYLVIVPVLLWKVFHPRPHLIINSRGIHCKSGGTLPKVFLPWDHFECFVPRTIFFRPFIELRLKEKENRTIAEEFPAKTILIEASRKTGGYPFGFFPTNFADDPEKILGHIGRWIPKSRV